METNKHSYKQTNKDKQNKHDDERAKKRCCIWTRNEDDKRNVLKKTKGNFLKKSMKNAKEESKNQGW